MKKIALLIQAMTIFAACNTGKINEADSLKHFSEIDSLLQRKEFFAARDRYAAQTDQLTTFHRLKAGAEIDNAFNRLETSDEKIDSLFRDYSVKLSDKDKYHLLHIEQMNHSKLFEYQKAYEIIHQMTTRYKQQMTADELDDYQNTQKIWASLAKQPAQVIAIKDNTTLPIKHDKLGLQNLQVTLDTLNVDFIFDTGANFSTVTETTARKLNMRIMDTTTIEVGAITGLKVKSRIGVCPEFNLGKIKVQNAVFLVFPDEALAIPQAGFQINGIIGFPVIEAMKEIQLTKKGEFIVPQQRSNYTEQNMAIDFLNPVIYLDGENYTFDSGANSTTLYESYFTKHKKDIEAAYKETNLTIGGAGGNLTKKGYLVTFKTKVNNQTVALDSVQLFKEKIKDEKFFPGNIGQDLIKKFDRMTINFESMFIRFD
ncbi:MAG: retropepsin-like aspartic protease [Chitinophagaceae bacterium]